jgi:Cd2+/Zn2+-exporting ATPase
MTSHTHEHEHQASQTATCCAPAGPPPSFLESRLPPWLVARWQIALVVVALLNFVLAWVGERTLDFSEGLATALYIVTYIAAGYDVAMHAIPALFRRQLDTDILMLAAGGGAALLGEWSEGAFLLLLFAIGHAGERYALDRARNAIGALGSLMPKTAQVRRGSQWIEKSVDQLEVGDVVINRPGDRIAVDGEIVSGSSAIDQSAITGESVPVEKVEGDPVFAGTVNQNNALEIRMTKLAVDNTLSRVMQLVAEAEQQQSPSQQFAQHFTRQFVPAIFLAAVLVIMLPPLFGWLTWNDSIYRGLLLLVAASPCALAIGTPSAVLAGIAQGARSGVLIKGGAHLENLGRLRAIAFDKTGTITSGDFAVTDVIALNGVSEDHLLRVAGAVERQSNHPLAVAVVEAAQERGLSLPDAGGLENVPGRGVHSQVDGHRILIGSKKLYDASEDAAIHTLLGDDTRNKVDQLEADGRSTMIIAQGDRLIGILGLADTPRQNVNGILSALRKLGVERLIMLTGDHRRVAENIAAQVGLTDAKADLLPEQKLDAMRDLQRQYEVIGMVGDGVNDAPALAAATVGIAMGGAGTAVALETADVALMGDDLSKLPFAIGLGRASRRIIQQNLAISIGVIILLIVTSVIGLIPLGGAVVLHEGSTLVVVANALRLLAYRAESIVG